ncbi:KRAB-A domain-containing protein 2-like [Rhopalosiphum maidis]|uniref:KRAB-A domain-containing protein 2-like n=1 Tax=Rhopalosiphum maidis TaxID=43146 RepID=UPI000EFF5029|nr:KRAB-A domain-containing protein 2-like [Rhopalosiphum maidis]
MEQFYTELNILKANLGKNNTLLTDNRYDELVEKILMLKCMKTKKEPHDFWLLKRYDVLIVQDNRKLIFPVNENENILCYIRESELYDVLKNTHSSIGHGGRDRMIKELSNKYKNIARSVIELFLILCKPCQQKQKGIKKGVVVKLMFFNKFNSRCQVDLIDFQSHPDGKYRFRMVYQDHLTKFVILKPLEFKRTELPQRSLA